MKMKLCLKNSIVRRIPWWRDAAGSKGGTYARGALGTARPTRSKGETYLRGALGTARPTGSKGETYLRGALETARPTGLKGGICLCSWASGGLRRQAFSLIEMLVASALLVVIMLGLVAMFFQTDRAFRLGVVQSDTMEGGRATIELIARDLQELSSANQTNVTHFYVDRGWTGVTNELAPGEVRINVLQPFYLLRRANLQCRGVRYDFTAKGQPPGLAILNRLDTLSLPPADQARLTNAWEVNAFLATTSAKSDPRYYGTIVDGVVHLTLKAYDSVGNPITNFPYRLAWPDAFYEFRGTSMPAAVEVELGILDPKTLERARALTPANQARFLYQHAGSVHLFRQRIPIRSTQ